MTSYVHTYVLHYIEILLFDFDETPNLLRLPLPRICMNKFIILCSYVAIM